MKTVLVTGAGSGIGRATSLAFLAAGWTVFLCGRRSEALEATVAMSKHAEHGHCVVCDVSIPDEVDALFEAIKARTRRLDAIFNNAGSFCPASDFGDVSFEDWRKVMSVNLDGAFLVANRAYRMMRDQNPKGGRIINNGSISAHVPRLHSSPYTTSKHGVTGLTRSIALDGRLHDIVCSQIDIGNAATDMTVKMEEGSLQADGSVKAEPTFDATHVANQVVAMASLPLDVNVMFTTIAATKMPYIGRG